uniref:Uncharacterized protein n=1 Tax=Mus spicilegus TaxID=10103 RepID=A0A8C6GYV7_MUSSI
MVGWTVLETGIDIFSQGEAKLMESQLGLGWGTKQGPSYWQGQVEETLATGLLSVTVERAQCGDTWLSQGHLVPSQLPIPAQHQASPHSPHLCWPQAMLTTRTEVEQGGKRAVVGELGSETPQFIEEAVGTSLEWGEP